MTFWKGFSNRRLQQKVPCFLKNFDVISFYSVCFIVKVCFPAYGAKLPAHCPSSNASFTNSAHAPFRRCHGNQVARIATRKRHSTVQRDGRVGGGASPRFDVVLSPFIKRQERFPPCRSRFRAIVFFLHSEEYRAKQSKIWKSLWFGDNRDRSQGRSAITRAWRNFVPSAVGSRSRGPGY